MSTFNVGGIEVTISVFSLLLAVFVAYQSYEYVKKRMSRWADGVFIGSLAAAAAVLLSMLLHEVAHGVAVHLLGNSVAEVGLRWWGAFVRPEDSIFEMSPAQIIVIAAVGPAVNLVIGLCFLSLVLLLQESVLENSLQFVAYFNLLVFVCNMAPLIFTDGAKVLAGFVWLVTGSEALAKASVLVGPVITLVCYLFYRKIVKKNLHGLIKDL